MKLNTFIELITIFLNLVFAVFLIVKGKKVVSSYLFVLHILLTAIWAFILFLYDNPFFGNPRVWANMVFSVSFLQIPSLIIFSSYFPKRIAKPLKVLPTLLFTLLVFSLNIYGYWFTDLYIKEVIVHDTWTEAVITPYFFYYNALTYSLIMIVFRNFYISWVSSSGIERMQIKYILIGFALQSIPATLTAIILPIFGITRYFGINASSSLLFIGAVLYSIAKHRFLGIRFLVGKLSYYIIISAFVYIIYYSVILLQSHLWGGVFTYTSLIAGVFIALAFTFLYKEFDSILNKFLSKRLIYTDFSPYDVIEKLIKSTSTELKLKEIVQSILSITQNTLNVERVGIVVFNNKNGNDILFKELKSFEQNNEVNKNRLHNVIELWERQEKEGEKSEILVFQELIARKRGMYNTYQPYDQIIKFMRKEKLAIILPLNRKVQLNGMLLVGHKEEEEAFTIEEINLLENIIGNASVAVGRSLLYEEVQRFADTLKGRVNEATKELREKIQALKDARRRERDMIDILGHELRTPMSIIKSGFEYIAMLCGPNHTQMNENDRRKKILQYIEVINKNVEREVNLIDSLLGATKIDRGQLKLSRDKVNMLDVVGDSLLAEGGDANKKGLYIKFSSPEDWKDFPCAFADRERIQEVMDNLLNNAVKYTDKGGITIEVEHNEEFITVHIQDTGVGISPKDIQNLGRKFFRAKQYTEGSEKRAMKMVRAGGTGLGLYFTFKIVKMHGGKIWVDSVMNKGSTFHFSIPIYKGQRIEKIDLKDGSVDVFKRMGYRK
ncbi:hypothetical protein JW766_03405 [Candidatus Dojkabacteria bacterium]|nr:hypothetical protein [Candidatus Dojkabacteria bacterium]